MGIRSVQIFAGIWMYFLYPDIRLLFVHVEKLNTWIMIAIKCLRKAVLFLLSIPLEYWMEKQNISRKKYSYDCFVVSSIQ